MFFTFSQVYLEYILFLPKVFSSHITYVSKNGIKKKMVSTSDCVQCLFTKRLCQLLAWHAYYSVLGLLWLHLKLFKKYVCFYQPAGGSDATGRWVTCLTEKKKISIYSIVNLNRRVGLLPKVSFFRLKRIIGGSLLIYWFMTELSVCPSSQTEQIQPHAWNLLSLEDISIGGGPWNAPILLPRASLEKSCHTD